MVHGAGSDLRSGSTGSLAAAYAPDCWNRVSEIVGSQPVHRDRRRLVLHNTFFRFCDLLGRTLFKTNLRTPELLRVLDLLDILDKLPPKTEEGLSLSEPHIRPNPKLMCVTTECTVFSYAIEIPCTTVFTQAIRLV